jgi:hypothetical protein
LSLSKVFLLLPLHEFLHGRGVGGEDHDGQLTLDGLVAEVRVRLHHRIGDIDPQRALVFTTERSGIIDGYPQSPGLQRQIRSQQGGAHLPLETRFGKKRPQVQSVDLLVELVFRRNRALELGKLLFEFLPGRLDLLLELTLEGFLAGLGRDRLRLSRGSTFSLSGGSASDNRSSG